VFADEVLSQILSQTTLGVVIISYFRDDGLECQAWYRKSFGWMSSEMESVDDYQSVNDYTNLIVIDCQSDSH
jgi:hypothetical protein